MSSARSGSNFYHGGAPGLRIGDAVLPPSQTGQPSLASFGGHGVTRRDRIYVTTSREAAMIYAAMHQSGRGMLYRVEPEGEIEPDPDCLEPGLSWQCVHARIVARQKLAGKEVRRIQRMMLSPA